MLFMDRAASGAEKKRERGKEKGTFRARAFSELECFVFSLHCA
jgi:hypothetical protein